MKRRTLLIAAAGGALGAGALLRPRDVGQNHTDYFHALGTALDVDRQSRPILVIDRSVLQANIQTLMSHISDRFSYRIVAKSLPSLPLLETVMQESGSNRLMLFHQPFINQVARQIPSADILLGKPMPVAAAPTSNQETSGTTMYTREDTPSFISFDVSADHAIRLAGTPSPAAMTSPTTAATATRPPLACSAAATIAPTAGPVIIVMNRNRAAYVILSSHAQRQS